jgi:hypothetical protein
MKTLKTITFSRHNAKLIEAIKQKYPQALIAYNNQYAVFNTSKLKLDPFRRSGVDL